MKLPNGERADLDLKLEDYSLNFLHSQGKHKARVFESVLGITLENGADLLRTALLDAAANSDEAVLRGDNGYGVVYNLRFQLETGKGRATIMSGWIVLHGEDFPRLTTCYII
jgi:hypothetical protein